MRTAIFRISKKSTELSQQKSFTPDVTFRTDFPFADWESLKENLGTELGEVAIEPPDIEKTSKKGRKTK
jgi:hypothetical protein